MAFSTWQDLVPADTNWSEDIYVWDRTTGASSLVSAAPGGTAAGYSQEPSISDDGRYVAYRSKTGSTGASRTVVTDRRTRATTVLTGPGGTPLPAGRSVSSPAISGDGRTVAFTSNAVFTPRDDNGDWDAFVWEHARATVTLVSPALDGTAAGGALPDARISRDGRYVVFRSNLAKLTEPKPPAFGRVATSQAFEI